MVVGLLEGTESFLIDTTVKDLTEPEVRTLLRQSAIRRRVFLQWDKPCWCPW